MKNERQQQLGLVADDGNAWLAGVKAGETLKVFWDGAAQCEASLPPTFTPELLANALLLPCKMLEGQPHRTAEKFSAACATANPGTYANRWPTGRAGGDNHSNSAHTAG